MTQYHESHHPQQQQQQQQQPHRQRAGVRDERRQWLVLQDRKSRSLDYSFDDRPQQPAAPAQHHLTVDQRLPAPQSSGVDDEDHDEYRSRRRRLQETQRKSRSLDVYEPTVGPDGAAGPCRAAAVARLRRSPVRVIDELTEMTHRVGAQEQRYAAILTPQLLFSSASMSHFLQ